MVVAIVELTAPGMPPVAIVGGTGVNIRLSTSGDAHRATPDIDVVVGAHDPEAIEVLADEHERVREHTVIVAGIEVDVIPTEQVTDHELADLENDGDRLFTAGHRWAYETAEPVRVTTLGADAPTAVVGVGSAAGLVAAKSHAAGYPRPGRRANKHGGDLFDIYRLVEVFDGDGTLRAQLAAAPGGIGRIIAGVVRAEILTNPARAMRQMSSSTLVPLDVDRIVDALEPFADDLAG